MASYTLDSSNIPQMVTQAIKSSSGTYNKWCKDAQVGDFFFAGHQWEPEDEAYLRDQHRPIVTFNRVAKTLMLVMGTEINHRQEPLIRARNPRAPGANRLAEVTTTVVRWILDQCEGDEERTTAFFDLIRRGMGWVEFFMDYDTDPDGLFMIRRFDGLEARWDSSAKEPNLRDARWRARRRFMPREDIERFFGKDKIKDLESQKYDYDSQGEVVENVSPIPYGPNPDGGSKNFGEYNQPGRYGPYLVTQFQWWEWDEYFRTPDPQNPDKLISVAKDRFKHVERLAAAEGRPNPVKTTHWRKKYRQTNVSGECELETIDLPVADFTLQAMTGLWDAKNRVWFGLTRLMKDPQEYTNKFFSQTMDVFNRGRKNALIVAPDAVDDPRKFEREINSPGAIAVGNPEKIKELTNSSLPNTLPYLLELSEKAITDVPGINTEVLGASEGDQPGVTMRQRQTQGLTVLAPFFNNERRYRMTETRLCVEYGRIYVADGRLIRLNGPEGLVPQPPQGGGDGQTAPANPAQEGPVMLLFRDELSREYDIILDENPRNPNTKWEVWQQFMPFMQVALKLGMFKLLAKMMDYSPFPATIAEDVKHEFEQAAQAKMQNPNAFTPPGKGGQKAQPNPQLDQAKIQKLQTGSMVDVARAKALEAASKLKALAVGVDVHVASEKMKRDTASHHQQTRHAEEMHNVKRQGELVDQYGQAIQSVKEVGDVHAS